MGNGNIDVGTKTATSEPGQPIVERLANRDGPSKRRIENSIAPKAERPRNCGAMSQQCGDNSRGNQSAPQKFVQLVGFRDPKGQDKPSAPLAAPTKR